MKKMKWKTGDVVRLKSGGPKMTVSHVPDDGRIVVSCVWFIGDYSEHVCAAGFYAEALVSAEAK